MLRNGVAFNYCPRHLSLARYIIALYLSVALHKREKTGTIPVCSIAAMQNVQAQRLTTIYFCTVDILRRHTCAPRTSVLTSHGLEDARSDLNDSSGILIDIWNEKFLGKFGQIWANLGEELCFGWFAFL